MLNDHVQRFIPTPDSAYISCLDHGNTVFADDFLIAQKYKL